MMHPLDCQGTMSGKGPGQHSCGVLPVKPLQFPAMPCKLEGLVSFKGFARPCKLQCLAKVSL